MTYFDLPLPERELFHAVHGGPRPRAGRLRAYLRSRGVRMPCQVLAIYLGEKAHADLQRSKLRGACLLHIHPAMGYLLLSGGTERSERLLRRRRIPFGEPQAVAQPAALVAAIQSAIVSLRTRQLALVAKRLGPITFEDEVRARLEAEQAVRGAAREWRVKLKRWCQIVLVRHYRQLNTIRRKLVEFLALLTRDFSEGFGIDYPLSLTIQEIYATFAVTDLAARFPDLVTPLVPVLAQRRPEHLETEDRRALLSEPVRRALAVMRERFADPVGLAEIAEAVHSSAPHLSRLFRRETGRTLTEHLQVLRVASAQRRLAEGSEGILEIALASGFPTLEHFYRTFKRRVGLTPRAYRRAQRA